MKELSPSQRTAGTARLLMTAGALFAAEALLREQPDAAARHVERWLGGRGELLKV